MAEYTPSTEQVRRYWQYGANAWADEVARDDDTQADGTSIGAEFDRWLNKVKAEAWDEGYDRAESDHWGTGFWARGMRANPYINKEEK